VAVLFAGAVPGAELAADYGVMRRVAFAPWLIDAGVIAATLSSALASLLGAPRILQSLAADRLVPVLSFFAKGSGESGNPRRGVVLSGVIAAVTVGVGDLNLIAPVVSMFFLISYGLRPAATALRRRRHRHDRAAQRAGVRRCRFQPHPLAADTDAGHEHFHGVTVG
jgi:amino acid transporter